MKKSSTKFGFSVIEVVISVGILLAIVVAVSIALQTFLQLSRHTSDVTQATLLLEEGAEALLIMRDLDWDTNIDSLSLNTPYSFHWNGSAYAFSVSPVTIDGKYRREVVFEEFRRDGNGVPDDNGDVDDNTLLARISVYLVADDSLLGTANSLVHNSYDE